MTCAPVGGLGGCGSLVVEAVGFDDVAQAAPVTVKPPMANMTSRCLRVRTLVTLGLRFPYSTEPKSPGAPALSAVANGEVASHREVPSALERWKALMTGVAIAEAKRNAPEL